MAKLTELNQGRIMTQPSLVRLSSPNVGEMMLVVHDKDPFVEEGYQRESSVIPRFVSKLILIYGYYFRTFTTGYNASFSVCLAH